jgi:hypothetical protein
MADSLPWNIRAPGCVLGVRRRFHGLPHSDIDLDSDTDAAEDDEDNGQSSPQSQLSQSSEPDVERETEESNAHLDIGRSAEERRQNLLLQIQEDCAAAVTQRREWISEVLIIANISFFVSVS